MRMTVLGCIGLSVLAGGAVLTVASAHAAQPYTCVCKGDKKRFLASTRYCEHQFNVKECTQGQYDMTYSAACTKMGCSLPTEDDDAKLKENNVPCELVTKQGKQHGWAGMEKDIVTIADWFDKYLAKK